MAERRRKDALSTDTGWTLISWVALDRANSESIIELGARQALGGIFCADGLEFQ
jgi:hypothetical protein